MTSFGSFRLKALLSSSEDRKRDGYILLFLLSSSCYGKWPSSMLQNLSGLHYHVPASAFPLDVGLLLLPVTGGFIHFCSHFCSHSENIPSLNSFQLNPFVLPSVSCWDWQNLFEEIINVYQRTQEKKTSIRKSTGFSNSACPKQSLSPHPTHRTSFSHNLLHIINRDSILLVSQAQNL